jgi:long-chain acyl-CoA synthetase
MNFLKKIEKYNSNICLIDEKNNIFTYKNILESSQKISKNLKTRSLIFVLPTNNIEFITSYIGFFRKELVQMLIDPKIEVNLLENLVIKYLPTYLFVPIERNVKLNDYEIILRLKHYKILKVKKEKKYLLNKNLALLLSTSGSTGSKKFVRLSYKNILSNTQSISKYLSIKKNHRTITTMPPFYTYGLSILNTHLYTGASILVTNMRVIEKSFWEIFDKQKISSFGGVPYFYEILKKLRFEKKIFSNLKYFTQAGGALNINTNKYFLKYAEKNNLKFFVMYGQTEATSRMTYLPHKFSRKKVGSIGVPIPGGKIKLINKENKNALRGEIIYEGKNVSMGYAENYKDLATGDLNKGILKTGDIAIKDKSGYLYIVGRKKRSIKVLGHRINLDEIEKILSNKGYNCLCTGSENKVNIYYKNLKYEKEIIQFISSITNIHSSCFNLKYIKIFPLNKNNKIAYNMLKN